MMIVEHFVSEGETVDKVLEYVGVASSVYYYIPKVDAKPKGRKPSIFTETIDGRKIPNTKVIEEIKQLLGNEFVDYGYRKVTHWLRQNKNYIINEKKVYRLMTNHNLLNVKQKSSKGRRNWVKELVPNPIQPFENLELDIKYIYIHGQNRMALCLTIIDVYSRWVLGQYIDWQIRKFDVVDLFDKVFSTYELPRTVYVRNDNGSQFISKLVQDYLVKVNVVQEFTKPATPEQNAHIESYHSILERAICRRREFETMDDCQETFNRWIKFYNFERIHSGIKYLSPNKFLALHKSSFKWNSELESTLDCRKTILT